MGKANFCIIFKFYSHHKQKITGWSYYCTNPKAILYNFVDGDTSCVLCGAVRGLDIDKLGKFWKEFTDMVKNECVTNEKIDKLLDKYVDGNKTFQYCPLYRKKLTLMRLIKYYIIKLRRRYRSKK